MEAYREKVVEVLKKCGGGSFLRGWRVELDPDGSLDVSFLEFCKACSRLRIENIDAQMLFGEDSPNEMTLDELAPEVGQKVFQFRQWMTNQYGGPSEMYTILEPASSEGRISRTDFAEGILAAGFQASTEEIDEIFNLLDGSCCNSLAMEDVMFLDVDPKTREGAIEKMKMKDQIESDLILTKLHYDVKNKGYTPGHRLAERGWHAPFIEKLPHLVVEKNQAWRSRERARQSEAYAAWKRHIESTYGNGARAWRKGLDKKGTFTLSRDQLVQYIRTLNLDLDTRRLWHVLDRDCDGYLHLEEVCPLGSAAMAGLLDWSRREFGSCKAAWGKIRSVAKPPPSWKSLTSLKFPAFVGALCKLKWPYTNSPAWGHQLCFALDRDGCGIIGLSDLDWLDGWNPAGWLYSIPDRDAWLCLSRLLIDHFDKPLSAWRSMDDDDSNVVSWKEFEQVCNAVGFTGNRGGAWRYLDKDCSGTISLKEWHEESANQLASFKDFLDSEFGSVKLAFASIDTDNSGTVSFSELRRACKRRGWTGDVRSVFHCLGIRIARGHRTLSYKDLSFLDRWEPALDEKSLFDDSIQDPKNGEIKNEKRCKPRPPPPKSVEKAKPILKPSQSAPTLAMPENKTRHDPEMESVILNRKYGVGCFRRESLGSIKAELQKLKGEREAVKEDLDAWKWRGTVLMPEMLKCQELQYSQNEAPALDKFQLQTTQKVTQPNLRPKRKPKMKPIVGISGCWGAPKRTLPDKSANLSISTLDLVDFEASPKHGSVALSVVSGGSTEDFEDYSPTAKDYSATAKSAIDRSYIGCS